MTKKGYYYAWAALFVLCAGLGFVNAPVGAARNAMTVLSVVFFLPPAVLLYRAHREEDLAAIRLLRNLAALSLGLSCLLLVANFLTAGRSQWLGIAMHALLTVVSAPMLCAGNWVISLFLWACLLFSAIGLLRRQK